MSNSCPRALTFGLVVALIMALAALQGRAAAASDGCAKVEKEWSGNRSVATWLSGGFTLSMLEFDPGDQIQVGFGGIAQTGTLDMVFGALRTGDGKVVASGPKLSYTVSGVDHDTSLTLSGGARPPFGGIVMYKASCKPAASKG